MTLKVVTINMLSDLSRWEARRELIADQLAGLLPDIIAFQEVSLPKNPAAWIADQLSLRSNNLHSYEVYLCPKAGTWGEDEGIAILSCIPVNSQVSISLGEQGRVAQKIRLDIENEPVYFVNVHLLWQPGYSEERLRQAVKLMDWLEHLSSESPVVILGDFNDTPQSDVIRLVKTQYTSAYESVHDKEPDFTCPTPLPVSIRSSLRTILRFMPYIRISSLKLNWRGTLDYVFVNDKFRVQDSQVALNTHHPTKSKIYPSDHYGIYAEMVRNP